MTEYIPTLKELMQDAEENNIAVAYTLDTLKLAVRVCQDAKLDWFRTCDLANQMARGMYLKNKKAIDQGA